MEAQGTSRGVDAAAHAALRYRADIDGLRAVAVVSVVLYHADFHWLPGGFTGVDVFFVISGYLITRLIAQDVASERFTLAGFYVRRARRDWAGSSATSSRTTTVMSRANTWRVVRAVRPLRPRLPACNRHSDAGVHSSSALGRPACGSFQLESDDQRPWPAVDAERGAHVRHPESRYFAWRQRRL